MIRIIAAFLFLLIVGAAQAQVPGGGAMVPNASTYGLIPNIQVGCGGDATTAIQAALNTGRYAILPACPQTNPLLVSATINMPDNSTLCGQGHGATWIKEPNSANLAPIIQGNNSAGGANLQLNTGITVCGLSVDGNGLNQTAATLGNRCIYFLGVADLTINDVAITNCESDAIFVDGNGGQVGPCKITNIFINGTIGPGPGYGYGVFVAHAQRWCTVSNVFAQNTAETAFFDDASESIWSNLYASNTGGATFIGTSSGTSLTVTSVSGVLLAGETLTGQSVFQPAVPVTIVSQSSGTTGGPGVYVISASVSAPTPLTINAIGKSCLNAGTRTVNNPGGGGGSQTAWQPCPAGMWVRNTTNTSVSNSTFAKGSYYGLLIIGTRHSTFSGINATNNSGASNGVWDDIHFDLNAFLANGYGETHAVSLIGATVGANNQTLTSNANAISTPTSRYGLFINDGLAGSVGDAAMVAGGTGYAFGNTLSTSGGTASQVAQFNVAAAPGGIISTGPNGVVHNYTSGSGVYTVLPANPVTLTGGAGAGATANITWSSAYITGVNCGPTVTACSRLPAFITNWTVQTNP